MSLINHLESLDNADDNPEIIPEVLVIVDHTSWAVTWVELKELVSLYRNSDIIIRSVS